MNTCCFTGHREIPKEEIAGVWNNLDAVVEQFISLGVTKFYCGGALGFDTMAAQTILGKRRQHEMVALILILPCKTQAVSWKKEEQEVYEAILQEADEVFYCSEMYYRGCMQARNRKLIECGAYCVAYLRNAKGGHCLHGGVWKEVGTEYSISIGFGMVGNPSFVR